MDSSELGRKKRKGLGYKGLQKMEKEKTPSSGEKKVYKEWRRKELQGMKKERTPRNGERYDSLGVKKEKDSKEWRRKNS